MQIYSVTEEDLVASADIIKTIVVATLVKEKLLDYKLADDWCATHGLIIAKKNIFRTISRLWGTKKEESGFLWRVVELLDKSGLTGVL